MTTTDYATFLAEVRDQLAATAAQREAHLTALVARAPWVEWDASVVGARMAL